MPKAFLRFFNELNDLLPGYRRNTEFDAEFKDRRSVKDLIESLGVPHTEVDIIISNGKSVDFNYIVQENDHIHVHPALKIQDREGLMRLCPLSSSSIRFIVDTNLGNIARLMRMLGFDTYFDPNLSNRAIIEISNKEYRTIITTSRKILKFRDARFGLLLRPDGAERQIKNILFRLEIKDEIKPFSRCIRCNGILIHVQKEDIADRIPPKTESFCNAYSHCEYCDKIYWEGTHVFKMRELIDRLLSD